MMTENIKTLKRKSVNKHMTDYQILSRRQVELAIHIRAYRAKYNLSQDQFAKIATVYGQPMRIKFAQEEISCYENYQTIPTEKKMNALLMTLHITLEDLAA